MSVPVRLLEHTRSHNIGDEIQTAAVAQHVGSTDGFIDRDELQAWRGDATAVVMQGWFTKDPATFPPSPTVLPVYVGFHLSAHVRSVLDDPEVVEALRAHGPVGCRDAGTAAMLHAADIDAFVSGCLTTTFPLRTEEPEDGKVFLVDTQGVALPEELRAPESIRVSHQGAPWWSEEAKRRMAMDVLETYRTKARLVVTTRLHCALPCVAMGIPVVFVGDMTDPRLSPIDGLASIISFPNELRADTQANRLRRRSYWRQEMQHGNWDGFAADIETQKLNRVGLLANGLRMVGAHDAAENAERSRCLV